MQKGIKERKLPSHPRSSPPRPKSLQNTYPECKTVVVSVSMQCELHMLFFIPNVDVISSFKIIGTISINENATYQITIFYLAVCYYKLGEGITD